MSEAKFANSMNAFQRNLAKNFDYKPLKFIAQSSKTNYFTAE
ncbi:hypothetical protein NIES267_63250 [Calothrix parasitica NIES-267]|uniref:Uncharacterized protein n=1 Tax=Calothrix parasitica NIES-267 TaxID=1973488 RepID=A0A1Z4LZZ5_9CYAN|nr:hypothetical protein NIES267_63250 [Calothrix parasitica NIES-267]